MNTPDYLIIGSGLTGAVIARQLTDAGWNVLVLERRAHIGGNVHDHVHPSGIRVHTYGPHYFRTNNDTIWEFVNRFASFTPYQASLKSWVDGRFENWPIARSYIQSVIGAQWEPAFRGEPENFEEASLALMPKLIYEKFVKGYTEKQWGVPAKTLATELAKRFDVREDDDPRLMRHRHQGIPTNGYADMMQRILAGIPIILNCDYLQDRALFSAHKKTIFTGSIDEYFGNDLGKLAYRGQQREHEYMPDIDFAQPCGQVNNPDPTNGSYIRTLEWKHMMPAHFATRIQGTVLTRETPFSPQDPNQFEYPVPDQVNTKLHAAYMERAAQLPNVLICGRLGEYKYYDMDQAIARALLLAKRILAESPQ